MASVDNRERGWRAHRQPSNNTFRLISGCCWRGREWHTVWPARDANASIHKQITLSAVKLIQIGCSCRDYLYVDYTGCWLSMADKEGHVTHFQAYRLQSIAIRLQLRALGKGMSGWSRISAAAVSWQLPRTTVYSSLVQLIYIIVWCHRSRFFYSLDVGDRILRSPFNVNWFVGGRRADESPTFG